MQRSIVKLQSFSRGYLARKDVCAERDADITTNEVYFNQTVDDMACKMGSYTAECPKTQLIISRAVKLHSRPKLLLKT